MKILSIHQPQATLCVTDRGDGQAVKQFEVRSWPTSYRGRLLIASTARPPKPGNWLPAPWAIWNESGYVWWLDGRKGDPESDHYFPLNLGFIIGSVELVDCLPILDVYGTETHPGPWIEVGTSYRYVNLWLGPGLDVEVLTDQLPYCPFKPGDYAFRFEDAKPVEKRCPVCGGGGSVCPALQPCPCVRERRITDLCIATDCGICNGVGTCDPIPVKGHQRIWNWNPDD